MVRPALVRATQRGEKLGWSRVLVSYGTTKLESLTRRHLDLIIQNNERLAALDLNSAVRFNLDFENWLPWASEFFAPPEHSPHMIAGRLNEGEITRLRRCLRRRGVIQAL